MIGWLITLTMDLLLGFLLPWLFYLLLAGPAIYVAWRHDRASGWLVWLTVPAFVAWVVALGLRLAPAGFGALLETPVIAAVAVSMAYLRVFLLDKRLENARATSQWLMFALVVFAFLLRVFGPFGTMPM